MSSPPLIRHARPDDAVAIADVCTRAARAAYADLVTRDYLDRVISHFYGVDRLTREIAPGPDWFGFVVAEHASNVVGVAGTGRSAQHAGACELFALYVDPSVQRHGVGRLLVEHAMSTASGAGASRLDVAVVPGNLPALRFYEACRFNFFGERPVYAPHGQEGGPATVLVYTREGTSQDVPSVNAPGRAARH